MVSLGLLGGMDNLNYAVFIPENQREGPILTSFLGQQGIFGPLWAILDYNGRTEDLKGGSQGKKAHAIESHVKGVPLLMVN